MAVRMGISWGVVQCLEGLGCVAAGAGGWEQPARLLAAVEGLSEAIDTPLPPCQAEMFFPSQEATRLALGEERFARFWSEGRAMRLDQAVADALKDATRNGD